MTYFVIYWGDIEKNPLDDGCVFYFSYDDAAAFAARMVNKGYECNIFEGKKLDNQFQIGPQTK